MNDFVFQTVADIRFANGALTSIPNLLQDKFASKSVLIVTDQGLCKLGLIDKLIKLLEEADITVSLFNSVTADPPEEVILAAAQAAQDIDLVIGIGGGSSMDAAKLAAVLAMNEQPLNAMFGVDMVKSSRKPLVLIPTTAGTGSEVTPISIVTTGQSTKAGVVSACLYPDVAVLDPSLLLGLPAHITAETGIDAMVHAIEAYTSKIKKNPLSDNLATKALSLLAKHLPGAYRDGKDIQHRGGTMLGAMLAGQAFANAPVGAVHALAYPLGGIYHLAHGLTNALMLPHVLRFNLDHTYQEYAELADVLLPKCSGTAEAKAQRFVDYMCEFQEGLGLPKGLREVGIAESDLMHLAEQAMLQTRLLQNNPKVLTLQDAHNIYQQAW
ncbi:iron-containing alcohol dehydrogenase [Paraglaciecola sp. 2405UD69-4]|uniref:iron-containing alcohol dehydrogenase n=1 Tax=Paraglaciecola sp. 2405UD69-4 TaxID=3391836 RepID=UPI0039C9BE89